MTIFISWIERISLFLSHLANIWDHARHAIEKHKTPQANPVAVSIGVVIDEDQAYRIYCDLHKHFGEDS